jgi:hypothetical protein
MMNVSSVSRGGRAATKKDHPLHPWSCEEMGEIGVFKKNSLWFQMANSKNFNFFTPSLLEREGMSKGNLHFFTKSLK